MPGVQSGTGATTLPDIGELSYNGVKFSCLYTSKVSGAVSPDVAGRTVRAVDVTITVDGVVTLNDGDLTTDNTWVNLQRRLTVFGGMLTYSGKGFGPFVVNRPVNVGPGLPERSARDIAWGPKPKILEFQPLGASRGAFIRWTVTTTVPMIAMPVGPLVQFNQENHLTYDEDGYAGISIRGTMEIPLSRATVNDRTVPFTVDDFRAQFLSIDIDLTKFRVTRREFNTSRDRRLMEWEFAAEQLPPMGLPPAVVNARGHYTVRPRKSGFGLCSWNCTLNVTYTVREDRSARVAWWSFLSLLKYRMSQSTLGFVPGLGQNGVPNQQPPFIPFLGGLVPILPLPVPALDIAQQFRRILEAQQQADQGDLGKMNAWIYSFEITEGLYLDSKSHSFSASWMLITTINKILQASGVWRWHQGSLGGKLWAGSVEDVMRHRSYLQMPLDPKADVLVDIGLQ